MSEGKGAGSGRDSTAKASPVMRSTRQTVAAHSAIAITPPWASMSRMSLCVGRFCVRSATL